MQGRRRWAHAGIDCLPFLPVPFSIVNRHTWSSTKRQFLIGAPTIDNEHNPLVSSTHLSNNVYPQVSATKTLCWRPRGRAVNDGNQHHTHPAYHFIFVQTQEMYSVMLMVTRSVSHPQPPESRWTPHQEMTINNTEYIPRVQQWLSCGFRLLFSTATGGDERVAD